MLLKLVPKWSLFFDFDISHMLPSFFFFCLLLNAVGFGSAFPLVTVMELKQVSNVCKLIFRLY